MSVEFCRSEVLHVPEVARIIFEAFHTLNQRHGFGDDIPDLATASMITGMLVGRPDFYGLTAMLDGRIVGCNFAQVSDEVAGIGPICVDPRVQGRGVGKELMRRIVRHCLEHHGPMVRLLQDSFNTASLSLYTSLGYTVQEPMVLMEVRPAESADGTVRPLRVEDVAAADALCREVYKVSRRNELAGAIESGAGAGIVPHGRFAGGRMVASLIPGFFGFGVGLTAEDLIVTARQTARVTPAPLHRIFIPARHGELFRLALREGFRTVKVMSLMSIGPYASPTHAWSSSIAY